MTSSTGSARHRVAPTCLTGALALVLTTMLTASLIAGIPVLPGVPTPPAAHAAATPGRLCYGTQASGSFAAGSGPVSFKLFVPAGATVQVSGSIVMFSPRGGGVWDTLFKITMFRSWAVGPGGYNPPGEPGPFHHSFSDTKGNGGASGDWDLIVSNEWAARIDWRFTATIVNGVGVPPGPCTMTPGETLGDNCAAKHASKAQVQMVDPVNTATGNFHEAFADFVIPGRGPGIAQTHAYNSLRAGRDGPLGYGWTHAYAMSLSETAAVATVVQEGGAELLFYRDGAGGYQAPPRAVATLVKNAEGTYVLQRCNADTLRFSPAGQLMSIRDRNGYETTLQYTDGRLASITDSAERRITFGWTGALITSIADSSIPPRTVGFDYDAAGDLTDYSDVGAATWHFTYDSSHRLETMRRPNQAGAVDPAVTRNTYDAGGRVLTQTDELDRLTAFDYSSIPGSTKVTDPKGNVTVIAYRNYLPTSLTRGWGTPEAATWAFEIDRTGAVGTVTDPNTHVVRNIYDNNGNLTSSLDPLNRLMEATYNAFDQPLTVTDRARVTTTYTYDAVGNLKSVSIPLVGTTLLRRTTLAYDPARPGEVASVTDPKGKVWPRSYDSFGNLVGEVDPLGSTTLYGYDTAKGWLTSAVSPRGAAAGVTAGCTPPAKGCATFAHDAWGRVTVATDANSHSSIRHYDLDGNVDYAIDAEGNRSDFVYDDADQAVRSERADGTELTTTYWPDGTVRTTTDGAQRATAYDYDAQGRLSSVTDPNARTTTYGYDPGGNLRTKADHRGSCPGTACTSMGYDAADQLTSVTYGDATTPNVTAISYDGAGRRTSMVDGSGTSTWSWDSLGRLKSTKSGAGKVVAYGYDNLRDPATTITYPGGTPANKVVTRGFDDAGRMTTIGDWLTNTTTFAPDADSNLETVTRPAGTGLVDTYAFDDADRLMSITDRRGGATVASFAYGRDKNGQVTSTTTAGLADTHAYTYTDLNELDTVDAAPYRYDDADNLVAAPTVAALAYDRANQLCWAAPTPGTACANPPAGATTYSHDSRGNRTSTRPPSGPVSDYGYDQANRMVSATVAPAPAPAPADAAAAGRYAPLPPARILDTRDGTGGMAGPVGAGSTVEVAVTGRGGVPASGVSAVALNVTVTQPTATGYLTLFPAGEALPLAANPNFTPDKTVPNLVVVKVGAGGKVSMFNRAGATQVIYDVAGWFSDSGPGDGGRYEPLVPARILDTRDGTGAGVRLGPGASLDLQVAGRGGVPATGAAAAVLNVAATSTTATSYLSVYPTGDPRPLAANLNVTAGDTVANRAMAKLGTGGKVTIYNNAGSADVVVDVGGWFTDATVAGTAGGYTPLAPARVLDTRDATGAVTGPLGAGATTDVQITGRGGVPVAGVSAVILNVTVTQPAGPGWITMFPAGAARPLASDLNFAAGETRPNLVVVRLGTEGKLSLFTQTATHAVFDVAGWFAAEAPAPPPAVVATYAYDGDGLRTSKTVNGATTSFTWEASSGMPLLIDDGTNHYLYGPDGLPLSHIDANNVVTWYHHDQLGSTRVLSDNASAIVATATYDPYGRRTASTGTLSPLGFAGEYTDAETGFVYLRALYYDPATAQFLTRDPLGPAAGHPYAYAAGDPLNLTDPSGLCPMCLPVLARSPHRGGDRHRHAAGLPGGEGLRCEPEQRQLDPGGDLGRVRGGKPGAD